MLITLSVFLFKNISSQNLIQNSSFENFAIQIDCNGGFDVAGVPSNYHIVDDWYTFNTPDYFNGMCSSSSSYYNVPNCYFGECYAKDGDAFSGLYMYKKSSEMKEYVYQYLSASLIADSVYCLSFYANRSDRFPFAIKQIGAYFSNNIPATPFGYINAIPQVSNTAVFVTDTVNWVEIKGCFTALGGEQYITIGNFNTNANTDTLRIQSTNPLTGTGTDVAYYYIDSVSLWKNNFPTAIKEIDKNDGFSVYPNPTEGKLKLVGQNVKDIEHCIIKIKDVLGREVLVSNYKEEFDIALFEKGIYFLSVYKSKTLLGTKKIIRE